MEPITSPISATASGSIWSSDANSWRTWDRQSPSVVATAILWASTCWSKSEWGELWTYWFQSRWARTCTASCCSRRRCRDEIPSFLRRFLLCQFMHVSIRQQIVSTPLHAGLRGRLLRVQAVRSQRAELSGLHRQMADQRVRGHRTGDPAGYRWDRRDAPMRLGAPAQMRRTSLRAGIGPGHGRSGSLTMAMGPLILRSYRHATIVSLVFHISRSAASQLRHPNRDAVCRRRATHFETSSLFPFLPCNRQM